MERIQKEKKQTDSDKPKPVDIELQIPLMQLEEPTHEEAYEEVKNFNYTKIILTLSRQFKYQQMVAKETNFQKERADRAYKEVTNLRTALELSQLTRKEAQNHELLKNEKKLKEQLKYEDARFQKITLSYNTVKNTLTALLQNQELALAVAFTLDSAIANTLAALQEELQIEKLQRQLLVSGFMSQTAQHEAKLDEQVKDLGHDFLPLPLMRHEAILWKEKMKPAVPQNEEGGYEDGEKDEAPIVLNSKDSKELSMQDLDNGEKDEAPIVLNSKDSKELSMQDLDSTEVEKQANIGGEEETRLHEQQGWIRVDLVVAGYTFDEALKALNTRAKVQEHEVTTISVEPTTKTTVREPTSVKLGTSNPTFWESTSVEPTTKTTVQELTSVELGTSNTTAWEATFVKSTTKTFVQELTSVKLGTSNTAV
ncbi:hypothetical protein L7F22_031847 [Adiantum nelumboides]|nr:hypothetical protein [Adiantum nelumboides]